MEEIVSPLIVYPPQAPAWTTAESVRLLMGPGLTEPLLAGQLRRFAQQRWIHPARQRGSGPTAANLFPAPAILAARVLSSLASDLAIEDRSLMATVSRALYGRESGEPPATLRDAAGVERTVPPVVAAAVGATRGELWVLAVTVWRGERSGRREVRARVYDGEGPWRSEQELHDPEMLPIHVSTTHLSPLLAPVHQRILDALRVSAGN